jgi:hypothetical protein
VRPTLWLDLLATEINFVTEWTWSDLQDLIFWQVQLDDELAEKYKHEIDLLKNFFNWR